MEVIELKSFFGLAGIPFLIAIGQFAKAQGFPSKRVPMLVMGLSLVLNMVLSIPLVVNPYLAILIGILTGLASSGFYSNQKALRGM